MPGVKSPVASILVVDDEPEINNVLCDLLSVQYECASAGSAEEALELLRQQSFNLVISDITMTGMSGLEMVPHVLDVSPQTVVVLISGAQTIESAIEALRVGAFDYIMKPFDLRQVEAVVKRALEHYDLRESKEHRHRMVEERHKNGGTFETRPPLMLECSYAMTAWTQAVEDEHRLLSQVLGVFFAFPELPH